LLNKRGTACAATPEEIERMISYISLLVDEHYSACNICYIDSSDRLCIFCREVTRLLVLQGQWMEKLKDIEKQKKLLDRIYRE